MRVLAVVRGTLFGTALLAAGIVGWGTVGPALERAGWRAELLRSEPPSALPVTQLRLHACLAPDDERSIDSSQ